MSKAGGVISRNPGIPAVGSRGLISIGGREGGGFARISPSALAVPRVGINIGYWGESKPLSFAGLRSQNIFSQPLPNFSPTENILATAGNGLSRKNESSGPFKRSQIKPLEERRVGRFPNHFNNNEESAIDLVKTSIEISKPIEIEANSNREDIQKRRLSPVVKMAIKSNLESARRIAAIRVEGISFASVAQEAFTLAIQKQHIPPDVAKRGLAELNQTANQPKDHGAIEVLSDIQTSAQPKPEPDIPPPKGKKDGDGGDRNKNEKKITSQTPFEIDYEVDSVAAEERKKLWMKIGNYLLEKVPVIEVTAQLLARVIPDNTKHPKQTSQELLEYVGHSETTVPKDGSVTGSKSELNHNKGWWGKVTNAFQLEKLIDYTIAKHPPTRKTNYITTRRATSDERERVWKHVLHNQYFQTT